MRWPWSASRPAGRFPAFPLRQPGRAEGGEVVLARGRQLRQLQSVHRARHAPAPVSSGLGHADPQPNADEPSTGYGHLAQTIEVAADRSYVAFELRPAGALPRRQAGHRRGRGLDVRDAARPGPADLPAVLRRRGPGRGRRAARAWCSTSRPPATGTAADPRRAGGAAEALVGGPRLRRAADRSAARLRPLSASAISSSAARCTSSGCRTTGRAICRPAAGWHNFDAVRTEYFRDATVALEAFKAGQVDFRLENIAKVWATAYDFPAVAEGLGEEGAFPPAPADRHAGLRDEHPPPGVRRPAGARGAWRRCSTSSG